MRDDAATQRNALKTAFKRLIGDMGGVVAAASCTRVGTSQLSDYGNVNIQDKMPPIDVVLDLEFVTGAPHVTCELARLQGFEISRTEIRPAHELVACLQSISQDNGKLFAQAVHVLKAGAMTRPEKHRMVSELHHVISAAREAICALEAAP